MSPWLFGKVDKDSKFFLQTSEANLLSWVGVKWKSSEGVLLQLQRLEFMLLLGFVPKATYPLLTQL